MKKTTLLVAAFAASLMAAKTSFAAGPQLFITKDTYACIDGSDTTPALLSKLIDAHDTAGIAALCQQGKVVPVQKGWEVGGTEYELADNPMETVYLGAELQLRLKRTMMTLRRDCLSTQKVAEDQFNLQTCQGSLFTKAAAGLPGTSKVASLWLMPIVISLSMSIREL